MKFLKIALLTGLTLCCTQTYAELVPVEEAIEAYDVDISIHGSGNGYLLARQCDGCESVRLNIDSNTSTRIDKHPVRTDKKLSGKWSGGIVIYNVKTKAVTRLGLNSPAAGS